MVKKRTFAFAIVAFVLGVYLLAFVFAQGVNEGIVGLTIINPNPYVAILFPENTTYTHPYSPTFDYPLDLNVTANFETTGWWYTLENVACGVTSGVVQFLPNTTIDAYRGSNVLHVYANDTINQEFTDNVTFFINTTNHAPLFDGVASEYFFCEDSSESYLFTANDTDGDDLSFFLSPSQAPFFIDSVGAELAYVCNNLKIEQGEIFSQNIERSDLQGQQGWLTLTKDVSVVDDSVHQLSDQREVNLTIIEVNDFPVIENDLSVYTVWATAPNNTFRYQLNISDEESGDQLSGLLSLSVTVLNGDQFVSINQSGWLNFSGHANLIPPGAESAVYTAEVCVEDQALPITHPNIGFCVNPDDTPHTGLANTVCDLFEITVTNQNRPPTIYPHYPFSLELNVTGNTDVYFNVSEFDPEGTTPSTYWYVNNQLIERDDGSLHDEFIFNFGCGVGGLHYVRADATDGELNDSIEWRVQVAEVACSTNRGGGGGGGGGPSQQSCEPKWGCGDFSLCQNAAQSRGVGILSGIDYRIIQEQCRFNFWEESICGYQIRTCTDVNYCNLTSDIPDEIQECHFSTAPNCADGIKNCHDGSCEFLVDCGGPCGACPTCSDGLQNQGEAGVDCGGPCPNLCPAELPLPGVLGRLLLYLFDNPAILISSIVILGLLVVLIIRFYKVYVLERDVNRPN